jgi:hypothetical protein
MTGSLGFLRMLDRGRMDVACAFTGAHFVRERDSLSLADCLSTRGVQAAGASVARFSSRCWQKRPACSPLCP